MAVDQPGHRSGSLKQANKGHKHGAHRSKRAIDAANKGRVSVKASTIKARRELKREERRHQSNQIRKNKREEAIALKRSIGGTNTAPFLTCVLALNESIDPFSAMAILEGCDSEAVVNKTQSVTHISIPRLKQRFSFIVPPIGKHNELTALDYLKVCDSTLLLISATASEDELLDKWGTKIMSMATSQGIPTPIIALMDLESVAPKRRSQIKSNIQKFVNKLVANERAMTLDSNSDGLNMFRRIGGQKRNVLLNKMNRPHLFGEKFEYNEGEKSLKVTGFLRGTPLNVNGLVHIPGLGDFQMSRIDGIVDPYKTGERRNEMADAVKILAKADHNLQTSLVRENEIDEMDAEQPWPTEEEIAASREENKKTKLVKRIPKGMSDYQAAWIPDVEEVSEDDDESDEESENEAYMSCNSDNEMKDDQIDDEEEVEQEFDEMSVTSEVQVNEEAYDKAMDLDEEKKSLDKIKAAQEEKRWPDEVETPRNVPAQIRFQKYRGLESFRTSPWDTKENLPLDYARIFQFQNFERTKKRVIKEAKELDGVLPGWYITIHIANVDSKLWEMYRTVNQYVVVYGLLAHEHQMSVMNVVMKRVPGSEIPIKSKERMICQVGYRRFVVNPVFSQHSNGDKHKYERFFRAEDTVVATFFAPIQFPPAPVLCFLPNPNTTLSLVATGRLISCNPDRIILKRAVLSGHPFKIHRKTATIRYMFFNKDDIHYFKPCKLRTRCGRLGHIKESLGTHGHMKCIFDGPIKSFDTVFLNLYKRVFPKWNFEECLVQDTQNTTSGKELEGAMMQE